MEAVETVSIITLAATALKKAEKSGASQVEAFIINTHSRSVYIENSKPRVADDKFETGLGLKVSVGKRVGFASGTVDMGSVDGIVNEAMTVARTTEEDQNFKSLPTGRKFSGKVEGAYSEETYHIRLEEIVEKAMTAVKAAEKTKNVKVPLGMIRIGDYQLHVSNSLGINFDHKGTMVFSYLTSKASVGDRAGEGIERAWTTNISELDFEYVGNAIAEKAVATLNAESFMENRKVTALIAPTELEGLLFPLEFATSSEQVNKKSSPWANHLGNMVASEKLTVWDDGRYSGGMRSALADDEGVETSKKIIIDAGRLQSFIYDSYNANIACVKATGNGFRRGTRSIEGAFSSPAACSYSSTVVKPGYNRIDRIVSNIDKGVFVENFATPEVNHISGAFGCEVRNATLIEGGQLTKHVKHALLTGNMYEALKNVFDISQETKIVENTVLPHMAFSDVTLVGQK